MMRRALLLCLATLVAAPALAPAPAAAQGDWNVKRDPFDRRLVARYKRILAKNPGDQRALAKLVRLYKRYRSVALLIKQYENQLEKNPKRFSTLVVLGHLHLGQNRAEEARAYYEKAAELKPKSATVHLSLGKLYRRSGEPAKAQASYDRALAAVKRKKRKKKILRELADIALDRGDIASAEGYFDDYIALDPKNVQARLELADALLQHEKHDEAIEAYKEAEKRLRADPQMRVKVIARLGAAYEAAGEEEAAIRAYRRAMSKTRRGYYLRKELTARIIDIYRRRQELRSLIAHYEEKWPARRRDHFEWDLLARLYEEVGLQDKAIHAYRRATKKAPYELDTQRRLIKLLENAGREEEAIDQYEVVIRVAPGEPRFQIELAQRYRRTGKDKKALAMLRRVQRRFPGDAGVHAALADLYTRWGKEELALEAYVRLTRIEPSEVSHLVNLGEQYWLRNKKKKARKIWKKIVSRKTPENYARLGEVYAEHDLLNDALKMYARAIKLAPKRASSYRGRAGVYERQRHYTQAIEDWERVLALTPDKKANRPARREARRRVVSLLKRAGGRRLAQRVAKWTKAFEKEPPDLGAGYYLVEAHLRQNEYRKARRVLERILEINPEDTDAMNQLVKVYRAQRDYDRAVAVLERLAELSPGREREYYNKIAEIKTIVHQDEEAIEYALKALEKSPKDPVAHLRLAERYEDMQQYDKAIESYEKTIELDPRKYDAYFALARLYRNRDERTEAAKLYRQVLKRASDQEVLHKAGRLAIDLEELTRTLGELERVVAPLAFTFGHKEVYRRILVELYERYIPGLVAQRRRGTPEEKKRAAKELARLGEHGLKPLLEALSDEKDVSQQRIAVKVLGYLGNKGAAPPLVRLAKQPTGSPDKRRKHAIGTFLPTLDWDVRVEALVAAGRLGDPRTIPDLIELTRHRESSMREAAVFALGMTRDERAVGPLVRALDDNLDGVQMLGCLGLAHIGERNAVQKIIGVVRDEKRDDATRAACAFALGVLEDRRAVGPLAETLAEGNDEAQRSAAWALGRIGDRGALPALLSAYFSKRERVRRAVAWALPRAAGGKSAPDDDPTGFMEYPMRNGKFDGRAALRNLIPRLEAPALSPGVIVGHAKKLAAGLEEALHRHRDVVVRALGDLDAREDGLALGPLTARLDRAPRGQRRKVETALGRIGRAIFSDLERLTSHRDPMVRRRALSVLSKTGNPKAAPILKAALRDESESVRQAAMTSAARFARRHGKSASSLVEALASRLSANEWRQRMAAAEALGELGELAPEEPLRRALTGDPKSFVREAAAAALGRIGRKSAVPSLSRAADHEREINADVRAAAVRALGAIGDASAAPALRKAAKSDPSPEVRRAAARARSGSNGKK